MGTFENLDIDYAQEILTIRQSFKRGCDYDHIMHCAGMLLLNAPEEWQDTLQGLVLEITQRKILCELHGIK
ncbi:MAG: hypothetical protein ACRCXT_22580 [Paraclostridium sp.]